MKPWSGKNPKQTYYKDELGFYTLVNTKDWWQDIGILSTDANEREGYPTQKPEALLERIVKASSNKGGTILDAFCGCGTALAVAEKLGRKWIGIDISPSAIALIKNRMSSFASAGEDYEIIGMPQKIGDFFDHRGHGSHFENKASERSLQIKYNLSLNSTGYIRFSI